MAGVAPERAVSGQTTHGQARSLVLPRLRRAEWLAPLVLALLALLALALAYQARPLVTIDLGDYYDSAFLDEDSALAFHDREAGAISGGPAASTAPLAWPADSNMLQVPGGRGGVWLATLRAGATQSDEALRLTDLDVNGQRVSVIRRFAGGLVALIPASITAAPTLELELAPALTGGSLPPVGTVATLELTPAETYRWSRGTSALRLPGLGHGDWQITLDAVVAHPDDQPLHATVAANGTVIAQLPERRELRSLHLFVPASLLPNGDLTLTIAAQTYDDPRPLGVLIERVRVAPAGSTPWLPPLGSLASMLAGALGLYAALRWMTGRAWLAASIGLAAALVASWALAVARFPTVLMLPRLAGLSLWSVLLLAGLFWLVPWGFRRAGLPLSRWLLVGLLLIFFAGYWVKTGGVLYPYFVGKDVSWHMDRVQLIINGRFWLLYGINSPLNESTMPVAEWGANRPVIPYSPWFHIVATSFSLLPLPLVLTAYLFSTLVDCSRVFLIALLARKIGLSERATLFAALLYAVTPVTFLLHSWGNIPTTFGMWWTLVCTVFIVVAYRRLDQPVPFLVLTLLLLISFLIYTVMAVFLGMFLVILIGLLLVWPGKETGRAGDRERGRPETRDPRPETSSPPTKRPVLALALATLAASALATLIYYGQYIEPIIERTIPYLTQTAPAGVTGVSYDPFGLYLEKYLWRMEYFNDRGGGYGLLLSLPLGLLGWCWLRGRLIGSVLAAWLTVALLFLVAGSRISMVDKHLFYLIPALVLGVGALFGRLWQRGVAARLVVLGVYGVTLAAALNLWLYRIVTVR